MCTFGLSCSDCNRHFTPLNVITGQMIEENKSNFTVVSASRRNIVNYFPMKDIPRYVLFLT